MARPGKSELPMWIRTAASAARRLRRVLEAEQIYVSNVASSTVPFAHLSKAFQVHRAVLVLSRAGFGSEAYALSRIIVEMYITLRWITNQDQEHRSKEFAGFVAKRKEYWAKVFAKYRPAGDSEAAEAVKYAENVYGTYASQYKSSIFWSNPPNSNLRILAEELELLYSPIAPHRDSALWDYEFPYSIASDHVHATVVALDTHHPARGMPYKPLRAKEPSLIRDAVFTATAWLFYITFRVDAYRQLGLRDKINKAYTPIANLVEPPAGPP